MVGNIPVWGETRRKDAGADEDLRGYGGSRSPDGRWAPGLCGADRLGGGVQGHDQPLRRVL